jgi:hypothetical protein
MENINEQQPVHVEHYQGTAPLTPRSTSGLAVTSMIFGILSMMGGGFFFLFLGGLATLAAIAGASSPH